MFGQVIVHCPAEKCWLRFAEPIEIVSAPSPAEVLPALREIGKELGLWSPFEANAPVSRTFAEPARPAGEMAAVGAGS